MIGIIAVVHAGALQRENHDQLLAATRKLPKAWEFLKAASLDADPRYQIYDHPRRR